MYREQDTSRFPAESTMPKRCPHIDDMTQHRGKADFRALRNTVGIDQKTLGLMLGNTTDMVKKWESEKFTYQPPDDA